MKRLIAGRNNAKHPRPKLSEAAVKTLSTAKEELARMLAGPGIKRLCEWIEGKGTDEQFWLAVQFAADRAGLPRRSEMDVAAESGGVVLFRVDGGLGWPEAVGDVGGGGGDGARTNGSA
jgi:hypothetical protein